MLSPPDNGSCNADFYYPTNRGRLLAACQSTVHDLNTGLSFASSTGQCDRIEPIDQDDLSAIQELFTASSHSYTYVGQRKLVDADAHVWIATIGDDSRRPTNVELYYIEREEKYEPAAVVVYEYGLFCLVKRRTTTVSYYVEEAFSWTQFDVRECLLDDRYYYDGEREKPIFVQLKLTEDTPGQANVMHQVIGFRNSLQVAMAKEMQVSTLRVSDVVVRLAEVLNGTIEVNFTILPWPNNAGEAATAQTSLADAYRRLEAAVQSGRSVKLQWSDKWEDQMSFQTGSLRDRSTGGDFAPLGPNPFERSESLEF